MKIKRLITSILIASAAVMLAMAFKATVHAQGNSGGVPAKEYKCVFFINGILQTVPGFTITGPGTYEDSNGKKGTYTFDSASSTLTFHGGMNDNVPAECVSKGGKMTIYILNKANRHRAYTCN